jgi:hypothetical protein
MAFRWAAMECLSLNLWPDGGVRIFGHLFVLLKLTLRIVAIALIAHLLGDHASFFGAPVFRVIDALWRRRWDLIFVWRLHLRLRHQRRN